MKKFFTALLLSSVCFFAQAQYNALTLYYSTGKLEEAKTEVDKLLEQPKTKDKPDTWYWKALVYSELYADSSFKSKYPDAGKQAFDALQTYTEKDPEIKKLKEDGGSRPLALLYGTAFNYGRNDFQGKNWEASYNDFSFCKQVSETIGKYKLTSSGNYTIDTTVVLYTGYAAQNAGKLDEAAKLYKELADWKVKDKDFEDIYRFILDYDTKHKNKESFDKYLAIAKQSFPEDSSLWNQFDMNYMSSNSGLTQIVAKYKEEDAAGTLNEDKYVSYGETFAQPDKDQADALDSMQKEDLRLTGADAFAKAAKLNASNGVYPYNAGILYYQTYLELDDRYYANRGESAALKAKRDAITKEEMKYADLSIEWLEKAYTILKAKTDRSNSDRNLLNNAVKNLANLYQWKKEKVKVTSPKDYDALDAKYKQYDAEYNSY